MSTLHIVVFPWLAFGHILPYLELSKSLARRGHRVSFISTPRNIQRLPTLPHELAHLIDLIAFDLPKVEGLAESAEATSDLPPESVGHLKAAFDRLACPFRTFINSPAHPKPDWIIHDFAHHWIPKIAADAAVPTIFFNIFSACFLVFIGHPSTPESRTAAEHYAVPPPWVPFPSNLCFRLHEAHKFFAEACWPDTSGVSAGERMKAVMEGCTAVAVRSSTEAEAEWLELAPHVLQKPVIPVGLLLAQPGDDNDDHSIMRWLDARRPRSVAYIAFGSELTLSAEFVRELALGLELSGVPFVWALRRPEDLPIGFEERTEERGVVVKGWAPQLKILGHGSVGGFLTHCGCSSLIEGLRFGHPLVLLPVLCDQGINARMMMEKGVAVEIERDEEDGRFTKEAVAEAVRLAIVDEGGETLRRRANELKESFGDGGRQEKHVDDFVGYLLNSTH